MSKTYYVTTPIYYVNDRPHLGHAYTSLAADTLARFKRLDGYRVKFLTGTDDHGQKVAGSAAKAGVTPQQFTDDVSQHFRDLAGALGLTNDDFIRTTEDRHKKAVAEIWRRLEAAGQIYLGAYSGWYSTRDEAYYAETELTERDGVKYSPFNSPCEWVEEPSYFFRLSEWGPKLLEYYEANPDFVQPQSRYNEVKRFVEGGLLDLSISRTTFDWGVPVPGAPGHVIYVWLDALTNYISALGWPAEGGDYADFWPADLHLMGKDIIRFHAVYWPAFLLAAGLPVPRKVFAHGWWTVEGEKMSKSLGNVLSPYDLMERYGLDQTRFFVLREVPFGNDGDFCHQAALNRVNADLANDFGNLAQRVLSMIQKNCAGAVPGKGALQAEDSALLAEAHGLLDRMRAEMDAVAFHKALDAFFAVTGKANAYVDAMAPWALRKTDPARMETVLWVLAETIRNLAILAQPFLPQAMEKLLPQLAVAADARGFDRLGAAHGLASGTPLPAPQGVFPRLDAAKPEAAAG